MFDDLLFKAYLFNLFSDYGQRSLPTLSRRTNKMIFANSKRFVFNECRTWPIIYVCFRFASSWKNSLRDLSSYQTPRSRMCSLYKLNPPGWNSDSTYRYGYGYGKNPINLLNYYSIVLALIAGIISIGFFSFLFEVRITLQWVRSTFRIWLRVSFSHDSSVRNYRRSI